MLTCSRVSQSIFRIPQAECEHMPLPDLPSTSTTRMPCKASAHSRRDTLAIRTSAPSLPLTQEEWEGFENTLDIQYYYDYSFGSPTGRAQRIGYLPHFTARA